MYVVELDLAGIVNVLCLVVVEDVCVLDSDVVNHTFCSVGNDTVLAATHIDVAHVDVLEVWQVLLFYWGSLQPMKLLGILIVIAGIFWDKKKTAVLET